MTPGHELRILDAMNNKVVDDMNVYESHEFESLDAMKTSGVWMI